jgi:hypothetical protein
MFVVSKSEIFMVALNIVESDKSGKPLLVSLAMGTV